MNTKQTPEQAAMEAMRKYSEWQNKHTITQYDSRQTIIKAFQDREELLAVLESIIIRWDDLPSDIYAMVNAAIIKATGES